jgi:hypothetical protein
MAEERDDLKGNMEYEALKDMIIDPQNPNPDGEPPAGTPPAGGETPPAGAGTPPVGSETPPAGGETPPAGTPPATPAPDQGELLLKEIFGDAFTTVDEAKGANIPGLLEEVKNLRQEKTDLTTKLESKPKTDFADDEVALYNVFVKETGIKDFGSFKKIHQSDVANMNPVDALIVRHVLENPGVDYDEGKLRRFFERKYSYDPELKGQGDEDNDHAEMLLAEDAQKAKRALKEVKDKLIVPEPEFEAPPVKELTEEEKSALTQGWTGVGAKVSEALAKLKVPIKNRKEALLDYEITEQEQKEVNNFVTQYAVENQMELNEQNVKVVSTMVYNQLMINKLPEIVHSVFEKARSMTEADIHALYENPSPARNNDTPPGEPESHISDEEKIQEEIFKAEMGRYDQ